MIWLICFFVLCYFLFSYLLWRLRWYELLPISTVYALGALGTLPFFLFEYGGVKYADAIHYVNGIHLLLLLVLILTKRKMQITESLNNQSPFPYQSLIVAAVFFGLILLKSMVLPVQGWDAFSMYDARAKMVLNHEHFSSFIEFSRYDNFNFNYYLSYPPMTSVIHAMVYTAGYQSPMIAYALFFGVLLLTYIGLFQLFGVRQKLQVLGLLTMLLHPLIISQTSVAYTNLPFLTFQVVSLYLLFIFLKSKSVTSILLSGLILGFGNWTRNEPTYISMVIIVGLILFLLMKEHFSVKKNVSLVIAYYFLANSLKYAWQFYIRQEVGLTSISETGGHNSLSIMQRVISGFYLDNLLSVTIFIYEWFSPFLVYLLISLAGSISYIYFRKLSKDQLMFEVSLLLIIFVTMGMLTAGTLYFSQTFVWWNQIGGSLARTGLLMVPVAVLYATVFLQHRIDILARKK